MKVTIACIGKFHAFYLAEELDKHGYLHKLITTYYSKKQNSYLRLRNDLENIDPSKVVANVLPALVGSGLGRLPYIGQLDNWNYYAACLFELWAKKQIDNCDIMVAWADTALSTLKVGKSHGAVTVVERGSSHILFQKKILEEEYEKYGIKTKPVDERIVEKELVEYEEADYISVPSSFAKQTYIERGINPSKIIQIPYGVDLSVFKPIQKDDDIFRVIFVGNLSIRKGVHYLLEAFSSLKLKNSELVLAGTLTPEVKPFLNLYKDGFKYIGRLPQKELYKYFSKSSVFVLPSLEEGLALTILQAMACGLPIICSTNTGALDIVNDSIDGFIIPIRDIETIQEKLLYLYENKEVCKKMGASALKKVHQSFTWNNYGDKMIESYKKILKK